MDQIVSNLKLAELKQGHLGKAHQQLESQASAFLLLSLQWKDLEEHYDSTRKAMRSFSEELEARERVVSLKEEQLVSLQNSISECSEELALKESELGVARGLVEKYNEEVRLKDTELVLAKERVCGVLEKIELKEKDLNLVSTKIEDYGKEIVVKENVFCTIKKRIEDSEKEFELKEKALARIAESIEDRSNDLILMETQAVLVKTLIEEHNEELQSKEKLYDNIRKQIKEHSAELKLKETELESIESKIAAKWKEKQNSISKCSEELALKERELGVARGLVEKYNEEVRLKDTELVLAKERVCGVLEKIELKERDLNLVSTKIEDYKKEIVVKENVFCMIKKRIEDSEKEFELKERALARIAESIKDCSNDLIMMEKHAESVKTLIEEHNEELQSKEKLYDTIQKQIKERSTELKLKETELESIESKIAIKWKEKRLDLIDTNIKKCAKELDSKEKELQLMDGKLKNYTKETTIKERDFNIMQKRTEEKKRELDIKEEQLKSTQNLIKDCEKEIELIREQLGFIQNLVLESSGPDSAKESVHEYASDLVSKEKENNSIQEMAKKCLHDLQLKQKQYGALKLSVEEQSQKLEMKRQEFKRQSEDLAEKEQVINCSFELSNKRLTDIESKAKSFELLKDSIDEQCKILLEKEEQFKNRVTELQEKEKKLDLLRVPMEKGPKEASLRGNARYTSLKRKNGQNDCSPCNISIVPFSEGTKSSGTKDGDELVRLLCEHLKMHDSIRMEVANALQTSSFPAEMVLDAMRWFYPSNMRIGDMEYDGNLTKRSCFILLAELMSIPAKITPPVKTEALKMANEWKAKMKSTNKNSIEMLGFLHLLANYGLTSSFNLEELQSFLNSLSDCKQVAYLQQALGITAISPISATFHSVKMEQLEALQANTAFNSALVKKELSTKSGHDLMLHEISATLQMSLDPAKLVLDVFQGYFSQQWRKEESDIEECLTRSYMLEQLAQMSPNIDLQVKKDAMKLAVEWSVKMTSQHEDLLVSFLRFLATYGLISSFKKEEILKFFEVVVLHKQAPDLFQLLDFTNQIFDDLIQDLISSDQVLKAIKVIFTFKLVDKFQPVQILKDYVTSAGSLSRRECRRKHSTEERAAMLDKEITALTDVIQCVTDCNLESEFPTRDLQTRILFLHEMKANPGYFEMGPSTETALPVKDNERPASDITVLKSQIGAPPTNSEAQNHPEMKPKLANFTDNPPYKQGMKKRHKTIVRPGTFPEFPQVRDRN